MPRHPVLFVSHGAPDLLLGIGSTGATAALWTALGRTLPRPSAILVISAHWQSTPLQVSSNPQPATVHDFSGFPAALYQRRYPAAGAPAMATQVRTLLEQAGITCHENPERGLDHGAWVPLSLLYPAADIPVTQLALPANGSAAQLLAIGTVLAPLRASGVLILASGAVTHNFSWLRAPGAAPDARATAFAEWLATALNTGGPQTLAAYRTNAPHAAAAHPSEEHLWPLLIAAGAGAPDPAQRFTPETSRGALVMDAWRWHETPLNLNPA